jgi:hypothetical protein
MDKIKEMSRGEGGKETDRERKISEKDTESNHIMCKKCGKKHKTSEHGAKGEAMKRAKSRSITNQQK